MVVVVVIVVVGVVLVVAAVVVVVVVVETVLDICKFWCRNISMFFFVFGLLVGVLGILVASMRSGVKFCAEWCSREVEGTILDPFCEKNVADVSAPKYANAE